MSAKEVDELIRAIEATGTHVKSNGRHHKIIDSTGNTVAILPRTPSDSRWRENAVHDLIRAGVLESDPKKNGGQKDRARNSRLTSPEVQALKIAAVKARHARFAEITAGIRERITPLIVKVGGWGMRDGQISASELGMAAMYWGRERSDVFRSEGAAKSSAQTNMKQAGTASEQACAFWEAFVSAWEAAEDPRRWYFDLIREMKGLPKIETSVIIGGEELVKSGPKKGLRRAGKVKTYMAEEKHPLEQPVIGSLALRAVFLMAVGRENVSEQEVLEVGKQILALEARNAITS